MVVDTFEAKMHGNSIQCLRCCVLPVHWEGDNFTARGVYTGISVWQVWLRHPSWPSSVDTTPIARSTRNRSCGIVSNDTQFGLNYDVGRTNEDGQFPTLYLCQLCCSFVCLEVLFFCYFWCCYVLNKTQMKCEKAQFAFAGLPPRV